MSKAWHWAWKSWGCEDFLAIWEGLDKFLKQNCLSQWRRTTVGQTVRATIRSDWQRRYICHSKKEALSLKILPSDPHGQYEWDSFMAGYAIGDHYHQSWSEVNSCLNCIQAMTKKDSQLFLQEWLLGESWSYFWCSEVFNLCQNSRTHVELWWQWSYR